MDALLGKWNLVRDKNEGIDAGYANALGMSPEVFSEFEKMQFSVTVTKDAGGSYTYTYNIEGLSESVVAGPFKLGETFDFYDNWGKRTEQRFFTIEGGKVIEKTTIKENPSCNWVCTRSIQDGLMTLDIVSASHKARQYFAKA